MKRTWLAAIIATFALPLWGCSIFPTQQVQESTSDSSTDLEQVYEQTVVAAANPAAGVAGKCVDCHTSTGSEADFPWADPSAGIAYSSGMSIGIVNTSNPSASLLIQYLTNGHCGSAECEVTSGSATYQAFVSAADAFAQAVNDSQSSPNPSGMPSTTPSATPQPSPTVSATALGGAVTTPVPFPSNPPLLGDTPIVVSVPILALNAAFGTSSIQLDVAYTVTGTSPTTGKLQYLYDLSNPVLANTTTAETISLAGFYIAWNGTVALDGNYFSNPATYDGTAPPGTSVTLAPAGALDSVTVWASPGDSLSIVVLSSTGAKE